MTHGISLFVLCAQKKKENPQSLLDGSVHTVESSKQPPSFISTSAIMSTAARRRLMRDFRKLQNDPPSGVSGAPMDNNIMLWQAVIFGYVCVLTTTASTTQELLSSWVEAESRMRSAPQRVVYLGLCIGVCVCRSACTDVLVMFVCIAARMTRRGRAVLST